MIPKSFDLMGTRVTVNFIPRDQWSDDEAVGFWNSENLTISLIEGLDQQRAEQVFFHELTHAILYSMAEYKLNDNEKFVDLMGSLIHQFWASNK